MKVLTRDEANALGRGECKLSRDIDGPFLDTGFWINEIDPYLVIHVPVVEAMGRACGMKSAEEYAALEAKVEDLKAQVAEYGEQAAEFEKALDGIAALKAVAA